MKNEWIRNFCSKIEQVMQEQNLSLKELAVKAKMSYSSLAPIVSGARECSLTKLIAIANALECSPNDLLEGAYQMKAAKKEKSPARYYIGFISFSDKTQVVFIDKKTEEKRTHCISSPLRCSEDADDFIDHILLTLNYFSSDKEKISPEETAIFCAVQQYGRVKKRKKIEAHGKSIFHDFKLESDAITNHKAFLKNQNGICISINDGNAITYSHDKCKTIQQLHGHGFPLSDIAGKYWLGCEAIKYTLNILENSKKPTALSDKILALFERDFEHFNEMIVTYPNESYLKASGILMQLFINNADAIKILEKSIALLKESIDEIDKKIGEKLPLLFCGELDYLYKNAFDKKRVLKSPASEMEEISVYVEKQF